MIQRQRDFSGRSIWLLVQNWVLIALGVLLAAHTSSGIRYDDGASLVLVVLLFSLFNLVLKPLLVFFTLPFIMVTFGLGIWIINAVVLMFVSELVPGFHVASFSSALWGAFVISLTSLVVNILLAPPQVRRFGGSHSESSKLSKDDDVIDI
jgi:putative membrane protein